MTEKYIDLASRISNESGAYHLRDTIIEGVLEWLDEHPDQVPGRTITESEAWDIAGRTFHRWGSVEELASHLRGTFRQLGITVVPDPEPTNTEKLSALYDQWLESDAPACRVSFGQFMDKAGVKAPGGDDEH